MSRFYLYSLQVAILFAIFSLATAQTPLTCPEICYDKKKDARKECKKFSEDKCVLQNCDPEIDGSEGFQCAEPTPTPTACPAVCSSSKKGVRKACKQLAFLGCEVQNCNLTSGKGKICAKPLTSCPEVCLSKKKEARRICKNVKDLGCKVQTCLFGDSVGYQCTGITSAPSCPGKCFSKKKDAKRQCRDASAQALGCEVQKCISPGESEAWSCGPQTLEIEDGVVIDNPEIGEEFTFQLPFTNDRSISKEDLYLLSDATGSMIGQIANVKTKFLDLVKARQEASTDAAFGLGFYRDESEDSRYGLKNGFKNLQSITKDIDRLTDQIPVLEAMGGGDGSEANLAALYQLATDPSIGWRDGSRRIIVYFGDFPGHEPTCVGGVPISRADVIAALNDAKIAVVAVDFGFLDRTTNAYNCDGTTTSVFNLPGQTSAITTATGGDMRVGEDADRLIEVIADLVSNLELEYERKPSDCGEYIDTVYSRGGVTPAFPFSLLPEGTAIVVQKITLKPEACSLPDSFFECSFEYTASNADLAPFVVRANGFTGC